VQHLNSAHPTPCFSHQCGWSMAIRIEINSCILSLISDIFPQEQCLHRGSIGGVECTLNGSSLPSTVNVEVYMEGIPIPQSGYRNSFPVPHRTITLNVLTLVQPFISMDLPAAFSLLCVAYDSSGLSVSPLQLSSESTVHIEGMSRVHCSWESTCWHCHHYSHTKWKINKCKLRVPNHGCVATLGITQGAPKACGYALPS